MKKLYLLLIGLCFTLVNYAQYKYVITGAIDNSASPGGKNDIHDGDSVLLDFINMDRKVVAHIKDNSFTIEDEVPYPSVAMLEYKYGGDLFLLDNSSYHYKLTCEKLDSISRKYNSSISTTSPFYNLWHEMFLKKGILYQQKDSIQRIITKLDPSKKDSLFIQNTNLHEVDTKLIALYRDFAREHPNTYYTAYLVAKAPDFSYANYIDVYNGFSDSIKSSFYGKNFKERLMASKTVSGTELVVSGDSNHFPAVSVVDLGLKKVEMNNAFFSKNKYTLVEFWASWCGPCRRMNKDMNAKVGEFRARHLEVVGFSLDNVSQPWKIAVKSDGMNWLQVSDLQGANSPLANFLKIEAIPYNVLVDSKGKIIARNLYGADLDNFLKSMN